MKTVIGWIFTALAGAFLLFDAGAKIAHIPQAVEGTVNLGYPESVVIPLGVILLICTLLYLLPRTCVLGAVLLTGYLGGAVASHVRVDHPLLTHTLFSVYVGIIVWLGLYLRDLRVRQLLFFRK